MSLEDLDDDILNDDDLSLDEDTKERFRAAVSGLKAGNAVNEQTPYELEFGSEAIAAAAAKAEMRDATQWLTLLRLLGAKGQSSDLQVASAASAPSSTADVGSEAAAVNDEQSVRVKTLVAEQSEMMARLKEQTEAMAAKDTEPQQQLQLQQQSSPTEGTPPELGGASRLRGSLWASPRTERPPDDTTRIAVSRTASLDGWRSPIREFGHTAASPTGEGVRPLQRWR